MAERNWKGKDWLGAAATLFALAVTFNAEYEIAIAVHIHPIVAYAVPGALDVYVLRALQVKRDVFLTVLAMVAVNAASHLVTAGVLAVSPALIVAVSAIAPLVLWRAHVLRHSASTEPVVSPVPEHEPEHVSQLCPCGAEVWGDLGAHQRAHGVWDRNVPDEAEAQRLISEHVSEWGDDWEPVPAFEEHADQAVSIVSPETVNVPEDDDDRQRMRAHWERNNQHAWDGKVWDMTSTPGRPGEPFLKYTSTDVHGSEHPFPGGSDWDGNIVDTTEHVPSTWGTDTDHRARVLSLVPPLPPEFPSVLEEGDKEFLDRARALPKLTFRALKELGMGNDRAARIKTYLESEHKEERS